MFSGYISTSNLFSGNGLEQYRDNSKVSMKVQVFTPSGSPYYIKGVHEFNLQHDPSTLSDAEGKPSYASKVGLGMTQEQNHYLNTTRGVVPFDFIITDDYNGPPHSTTDNEGNIVRNDFNNLYEVASWFNSLIAPVTEWQKPPYVRVSLGRYSKFGFIYKLAPTQWIRLQSNSEATIARIAFDLKLDTINTARDTAFYSVGKQ